MKTNARLTALLLAILLLVLSCQLPAFAATDEEASESIPQIDSTAATSTNPSATTLTAPDEMQLQPGDKTQAELQTMTLDPATVPEVLSYTAAQQKGHVNRIYAQEKNLNTVAFQNVDGTKTAYIYNSPVKYVDSMGNVRDKSTTLTLQSNGYAMLDNSVRAYFSQDVTNGICVEYDGYQITMTPSTTDMSAPTLYEDRVVYANVFNSVTLLSYQTKLNGVKEEIIAVKDEGQYDYEFTLDLQGLVPVKIDGIWYLKNSQDEIIADLGEVLIADSAGNTATGSMQIEADTAQNIYTLTITVPQDFMQASTTVYPVYIDPTVTITEEGALIYTGEDGDTVYEMHDVIIDTGLYSGTTPTNALHHKLEPGQSYIHYLLYDFYGEQGQFVDYEPHEIGKVTLNLYVEASDENEAEETVFEVYPLINNPFTTEDCFYDYLDGIYYLNQTVFYSCYDVDTYSTVPIDGTAGVKSINITNYVKGWLGADTTGNFDDASAGLAIASSYAGRMVRTSNYSDANDVYCKVDYGTLMGTYYINQDATGLFLTAPQTINSNTDSYPASVAYYQEGNHQKWQFDYFANDQYILRSAVNPNYALCVAGDDSAFEYGTVLVSALPETPTDAFLWKREYAADNNCFFRNGLYDGALYYEDEFLQAHPSSDATNAYRNWSSILTSDFTPVSSFEIDGETWIDANQSQQLTYSLGIYPTALYGNTFFEWSSDNPDVVSVTSSGYVTAHQNGSAVITVKHKPTQVTQQFAITVGQIIPNGTYYIFNKQVDLYLEAEATAIENENVQIGYYSNYDQFKWIITYLENGYYQITSPSSGKYVAAGANNSIVQTSQTGDQTWWRITININGSLKLIAKNGESSKLCLTIPSFFADGMNCLQTPYVADDHYPDEWYFANVNYSVEIFVAIDKAYRNQSQNDNKEFTTRIEQLIKDAKETFASRFFIHLNCSSNIIYSYESCADSCQNKDEGFCDCETSHIDHHTYPGKMTTDLRKEFNVNNQIVVVLFTGNEICHEYEDTETNTKVHTTNISGMANTYSDHTNLTIKYSSDDSIELNIFVHEIGHIFAAQDHYDSLGEPSTSKLNNGSNEGPYSEKCIYGESQWDPNVVDNLTICDGCKADIEETLLTYTP